MIEHYILPLATALFIGAIPVGYILGRLNGIDLRKHGSGNIGATNAGRILGKKIGVLTLIGDLVKGAFAASLVNLNFFAHDTIDIAAALGFAAIIGHCFSPFLKFQGGKGVATGLGVFAIVTPIPALVSVLVFILVFGTLRYVSLASILATLSLPISTALLPLASTENNALIFACCTSVLIIVRHHANITRLLQGTEPAGISHLPKGEESKFE